MPGRAAFFLARGLTKVYGEGPAAVHALRGVNVDIVRGAFVVLLGASGSGKSTLLNILGGLDTVCGGSAERCPYAVSTGSPGRTLRSRPQQRGIRPGWFGWRRSGVILPQTGACVADSVSCIGGVRVRLHAALRSAPHAH